MAFVRQIRTLFSESNSNPKQKIPSKDSRRKSLTVTISKEPPVIVYFERNIVEESFECIFDPKVHHDEEKDHPDLFKSDHYKKKYKDLKPWQEKPQPKISFKDKVKSTFKTTSIPILSTSIFMHSSNNHNVNQQSFV